MVSRRGPSSVLWAISSFVGWLWGGCGVATNCVVTQARCLGASQAFKAAKLQSCYPAVRSRSAPVRRSSTYFYWSRERDLVMSSVVGAKKLHNTERYAIRLCDRPPPLPARSRVRRALVSLRHGLNQFRIRDRNTNCWRSAGWHGRVGRSKSSAACT